MGRYLAWVVMQFNKESRQLNKEGGIDFPVSRSPCVEMLSFILLLKPPH